jgi:hypothetical protein
VQRKVRRTVLTFTHSTRTRREMLDEDKSPSIHPFLPLPPSSPRPTTPSPHTLCALIPAACSKPKVAEKSLDSPINRHVTGTYFGQVIPRVLGGGDVVAMARTGSGKTAAFLAPMVCRLVKAAKQDNVSGGRRVSGLRGLVLLPTRELALQTFLFFKRYAKFTTLSACLIAGGESIEAQFAALATNPEVPKT